jgi:hypothetical protein
MRFDERAASAGLESGNGAGGSAGRFRPGPESQSQSGRRPQLFSKLYRKSRARFARGVRALYLRFLDGRLYQIEIFYEERADVPTLESFVANLSVQMNFPADVSWKFEKSRARLDCGTFTLVADKPLNPRVELTDPAKLAEAAAKRKKSE